MEALPGHRAHSFLPLPQRIPSKDSFQWPAAWTLFTPEASSCPPATGKGQPDPCYASSASGCWLTTPRSPATLGTSKTPRPASAGGLCPGHVPSAESQSPLVAAGPASWPARLGSCGSQQPPQLWLRWVLNGPPGVLYSNPRAAARAPRPGPGLWSSCWQRFLMALDTVNLNL